MLLEWFAMLAFVALIAIFLGFDLSKSSAGMCPTCAQRERTGDLMRVGLLGPFLIIALWGLAETAHPSLRGGFEFGFSCTAFLVLSGRAIGLRYPHIVWGAR